MNAMCTNNFIIYISESIAMLHDSINKDYTLLTANVTSSEV